MWSRVEGEAQGRCVSREKSDERREGSAGGAGSAGIPHTLPGDDRMLKRWVVCAAQLRATSSQQEVAGARLGLPRSGGAWEMRC